MANSTKWQATIKSELDFHIENRTREAGELPPGRREISSNWVFKTKVNADGSLRYKADSDRGGDRDKRRSAGGFV